jgi:HPt (histidine-containing phosphotransfer) domain-containing protein
MYQPEQTGAITSSFSDDPDMTELIEMFVDELPERIDAVRRAMDEQSWDTLRTLSHQLKGAAPGYGFGPVGDAAAELERLVKDTADAEQIRDAVDSLLAVCGRVSKD